MTRRLRVNELAVEKGSVQMGRQELNPPIFVCGIKGCKHKYFESMYSLIEHIWRQHGGSRKDSKWFNILESCPRTL